MKKNKMTKYNIFFGKDFSNTGQIDSFDNFVFYDNTGGKTVKYIKDLVTCFNDAICSCMLKLYKKEKGWTGSYYSKYDIENENDKKIEEIAANSEIYIIQTKKECSCKFLLENKNLLSSNKENLIEKIKESQEKINELLKKDELDDAKQEDFYDIIIDINSIININKGWNIFMTKEGEEKYLKYKGFDFIKIGIVGNINRGKTFILSKLSKISGVSINTKGLSIKYPDLSEEYKDRKYIILDSAGLETPVLNNLLQEEENGKEEEEEKKSEENNNEAKKDEENKEFKKKARDILVTESFLQKFIITNSDILILVVGKLTFSEQKLILKIKKEIKDNKDIKYLYIIHNLKNYTKISQVEKYIENTLCKSSTFSVKKSESVGSNPKKIKDGYHFNEEKNAEYKQLNIFHLIFAQDGSEAGNFYNEYSIDFIETQYNVQWVKKKFDVIEEVKKQFSKLSKLYLEQKIEKNEFNSNEDILQNKIIKLDKEKELTLKKCLLDEIGNPIFKLNGLEPKHNVFVNEQFLEIRVELPGNCNPEVSPFNYSGEDTVITVSGNKNYDKEPKNPEDCIYNSREYGKFEIDIPFKTGEYRIIDQTLKEKKIKKGILILKYKIETNEKNEKTIIENEEDI